MKAHGFEVHAVSAPGPGLEQVAASEEIECHSLRLSRRIAPLDDLVSLMRLVLLFRRLSPTIVHAHMPKAGLLGMLAARCIGVPLRIYHNHGMPYTSATGWRRVLMRCVERVTYRQAHQVLCVSESVRQRAIQDGICASDHIKVLLSGSINGVDAEGRFDPQRFSVAQRAAIRAKHGISATALVIGFVGRLKRDKGLIELSGAWQVLRRDPREIHLVIVGPFEEEDRVPAQTEAALRADVRIHLVGEVRDTPSLYAAMDLFCLPTTYNEGMPVVLLEAAAMALPVVATSIPGCVDAVHAGVTGTLIPPRNLEALTEAIRAYLNDATLRRRHGDAGRKRVLRKFRPQALWKAQQAEYSRLLKRTIPSIA